MLELTSASICPREARRMLTYCLEQNYNYDINTQV